MDMRQSMNIKAWFVAIVCLVLAGKTNLAGANPEPEERRAFEVKGVVRRLVPEGNVLVIKHEVIPGYMDAMTMPLQVKDSAEMEGVGVGDRIAFRMIVTEDDGWIDRIRVLEKGQPEEEKPVIPGIRLVREVEVLEEGDPMPAYTFTNELGRAVSLEQFKGRTVALTFIYTRCPFPTFCPRQCRQFAEASELLAKELPGPPKRWQLLSLSFDPGYDTPSVLQAYARRFQYNPAQWSFLTGAMIDIDAITEQFGMIFARDGEGWSHNVRTVVIDPAGIIHKIYIGNDWTTDDLVGEMLNAARGSEQSELDPK